MLARASFLAVEARCVMLTRKSHSAAANGDNDPTARNGPSGDRQAETNPLYTLVGEDQEEEEELDEAATLGVAHQILAEIIAGHRFDEGMARTFLSPGVIPPVYPMLLNEAQVDRILKPFAESIGNINKQALARDLVLALVAYLTAKHGSSQRIMAERKQAYSMACRLRQLCKPGVIASGHVWPLDRLIEDLERESTADEEARREVLCVAITTMFPPPWLRTDEGHHEELERAANRVLGAATGIGRMSPFEGMAGSTLAAIYDAYLAPVVGPVGYTRDAGSDEVRGAYIDFAEASLRELNITNRGRPYSRKAIANAVNIARRGNSRRAPID